MDVIHTSIPIVFRAGSGPRLPYSLPQVLPVSLMTERENVIIWAEFAAIQQQMTQST